MFGWLLGKGKQEKSKGKPKSAAAKTADLVYAPDSVLPDFANEVGGVKSQLAEAADRAMQQRREQRKADRTGRREALFGVVREAMLRSGILSSAYKFKVLSIDQKGRHFLVLLDLSMELASSEPAERLLEIEKMIADTAMSRLQVVVQAVYWRHFVPGEAATVRLSTGDTQPGGLSASVRMGADAKSESAAEPRNFENSATDAITAALADMRAKNRAKAQERAAAEQQAAAAAAQIAPVAPVAASAAATLAAAEAIQRAQMGMAGQGGVETQSFPETQMQSRIGQADEDELAAFRRALQAGKPVDAPASIFVSGRALNGRADTDPAQTLEEMEAEQLGANLDSTPDQDLAQGIDLSGTQYGELPKF